MKQERILQVIQGPHVTEKSSMAAEAKQLVFKVDRRASKAEIKTAVEELFEVKVIAINTVLIKGKTKRFGARIGQRKNYKKAYVSLDKSTDMEALMAEQA
ncbi:MAG: 50S ribosomal protein L23 [Cardiobacteriales bacterium]|nr:MAG: 50S ribosomal protein L23 [Cardiobacteriales bacterium]